jgi:ubiquinol-cytochrome c reductase cytochrome b subunit
VRRILRWLDDQTGAITALRNFMEEPLPKAVGWPHIFGSLALFCFIIQVATGMILLAYYTPSPVNAYQSVQYINYDLLFGRLVRGLHHWTASAMLVLVGMHMLQAFFWGAYKRPRQIIWAIGVLLLVATMMLAFTGYLLPWDQKAYWAAVVGTNIAGTVPGIGGIIRAILRGGPNVGALSLTRFFAVHAFIMPALLAGLIGFHVLQLRRKGITPPWRRVGDEDVPKPQLFWPHQVLRDAIACLVVLALVLYAAWRLGAPIEPVADPAQTGYVPRPEWYFLWLFQLLKYFHPPLEFVGAVVLPTVAIILLLVYPYLDRNPERRASRRPWAYALGIGTFLAVSALGTAGIITSPAQPKLNAQQQHGQRIFMEQRCNECHSINGSGGGVIDLGGTHPEWTPQHLRKILRDPTSFNPRSTMPPVTLDEKDVDALVAFLMSITPGSRLPFEPTEGPRKPPSHFAEDWYLNHRFAVREDPQSCGTCHQPSFCQSCHRNRLPDSHLHNWLPAHSGVAQESPAFCQVCHDPAFCKACHVRMPHDSTWLTTHGPTATGERQVCLQCHDAASCANCHQGAVPPDHKHDWMKRHGTAAQAQAGKGCLNCHTQAFCDTCHTVHMPHPPNWRRQGHLQPGKDRPDACTLCHDRSFCQSCHGLPMPHPQNWPGTHGAQAVSSPAVCARCHQRADCWKCHQGNPPSSHDANWRKNHPQTAKQNPELCVLCHGKSGCLDCHQLPMPHPDNWALDHAKDKRASLKAGSICLNCHDRTKFCGVCHGTD